MTEGQRFDEAKARRKMEELLRGLRPDNIDQTLKAANALVEQAAGGGQDDLAFSLGRHLEEIVMYRGAVGKR